MQLLQTLYRSLPLQGICYGRCDLSEQVSRVLQLTIIIIPIRNVPMTNINNESENLALYFNNKVFGFEIYELIA